MTALQKILIYLSILVQSVAFAQTPLPSEEPWPQPLKLLYPETSQAVVTVDIRIIDQYLLANFDIQLPPGQKFYGKEKYNAKEYPFQFDVVELFVSVDDQDGSHYPYYEFEVSAWGQQYQVTVHKPGKMEGGVDLGFMWNIERSDVEGKWRVYMSIPLENLGWKGDPSKVIGNAYAILGQGNAKTYWSLHDLHLLPKKKPNFHKPEFFKLLGTKK